MKFTDDTKRFKDFINLITLPGKDVQGSNVFFDEVAVKLFKTKHGDAYMINPSQTGIGHVKYKPRDVIESGYFYCNDLEKILKKLRAIRSSDVTVECNNDSIVMRGGRTKISIPNCPIDDIQSSDMAKELLSKINIVENILDTGKTKAKYHVKTDSDTLSHAVFNSKLISSYSYPFEVRDGTLFITAQSQDSSITEEIGPVDGPDDEFTTDYLIGFDNVFRSLDGPVELWFDHNTPVYVKSTVNGIDVFYVIAPYMPFGSDDLDDEIDDSELLEALNDAVNEGE